MKPSVAKIFFLSLFLLIPVRCGEAAGVSSFTVNQMGGSDLIIEINGSSMPLPQVSGGGSVTMIVLPGVSGEKPRAYEKRVNEGANPLVTAVRARQTGGDFVITVMTARPVQLKETRGVPPCDTYTLRFKTSEELKKIAEERTIISPPRPRAPAGPFASDVPVTLDLRDAELRDVFRMFGEQLNKNVVIHDSMPSALVTMTFKNAPLSGVFGYLMRNYGLSCELLGEDTVVVGTAAGLAKISGKAETRAYRIAYADLSALSALLPKLTGAAPDSIVADPRLRTLYLTATPDIHEEAAIAIQKLDSPGKQVMLHARILQFTKGDSLEVEHTLNAVYDHWAMSYARGRFVGLYADGNRTGRLDAALSALETKTNAKIVANPSIVTIDGSEALISMADEFVYRSGVDENGNPEYDTFEVGPMLRITPRIGRDETITLTLDLRVSERLNTAETAETTVVAKSNRQVLTNVRVRNGEPFVVGGLFREDSTDSRFRVPVLGQLPLLGELFTYRIRNSGTSQVVMIVIPFILDTPDVPVEHEGIMIR